MKIIYGTDTGSIEDAHQCVLIDLPDHLDADDVEQWIEDNVDFNQAQPVTTVSEFCASMTEDQFYDVWAEAQKRFGYAGTYFGRDDVMDRLGRRITDAEWEAIQDTYEWKKGIPERLTERGWDVLAEAVTEAIHIT